MGRFDRRTFLRGAAATTGGVLVGGPLQALVAQATVEYKGEQVFKGGENNIVVYAIDQSSGEPTIIQHIDTRGIHPRTFHIDPSGRMMVVQHNRPVKVREGDAIRTVEGRRDTPYYLLGHSGGGQALMLDEEK